MKMRQLQITSKILFFLSLCLCRFPAKRTLIGGVAHVFSQQARTAATPFVSSSFCRISNPKTASQSLPVALSNSKPKHLLSLQRFLFKKKNQEASRRLPGQPSSHPPLLPPIEDRSQTLPLELLQLFVFLPSEPLLPTY